MGVLSRTQNLATLYIEAFVLPLERMFGDRREHHGDHPPCQPHLIPREFYLWDRTKDKKYRMNFPMKEKLYNFVNYSQKNSVSIQTCLNVYSDSIFSTFSYIQYCYAVTLDFS